jgi:hypothetical protein
MISFNEIKVLTEDFRAERDGIVLPKRNIEKVEIKPEKNVLSLTKKYIDRCFQKAKERGEAWASSF